MHDAEGQLLTGSFMDYAIPIAADLPALETIAVSFPSTRNELGIKGVGESGIIAAAGRHRQRGGGRAGRPGRGDHPGAHHARARLWESLRKAR